MSDNIRVSADKKNRFSNLEYIMLFLMFCAAVNVIGRYYYFMFFAFLLCAISPRSVLPINGTIVALIALSASILIFGDGINQLTEIIKPFLYPMSFVLGYNIVSNKRADADDGEYRLKMLVYLFAVGFLTHFLLNLVINIGSVVRNTVDFWSRERLSATSQTALACPAIACVCTVLVSPGKVWVKIVSVLALIAILAYSLILASRTAILMVLIMLGISFVYYFFARADRKSKMRLLCGVLIAILIVVICYQMNLFNIRTTVEKSNLYLRFFSDYSGQTISDDSRFEFKRQYLSLLEYYPFGGNHIFRHVGNYAHDLYLDTYDSFGVLAALAVIIYIASTIVRLIKLMTSPGLSYGTKQLVLCFFAVMYIEFLIEPILIGMQWLFAVFCFVDGAIAKLLTKKT